MMILISLGMISLSSCSTLEIAHDPIRLIDQKIPPLSTRIKSSDLSCLSDATFEELRKYIKAFKVRDESQHELAKRHNNNHKKDQ